MKGESAATARFSLKTVRGLGGKGDDVVGERRGYAYLALRIEPQHPSRSTHATLPNLKGAAALQ